MTSGRLSIVHRNRVTQGFRFWFTVFYYKRRGPDSIVNEEHYKLELSFLIVFLDILKETLMFYLFYF